MLQVNAGGGRNGSPGPTTAVPYLLEPDQPGHGGKAAPVVADLVSQLQGRGSARWGLDFTLEHHPPPVYGEGLGGRAKGLPGRITQGAQLAKDGPERGRHQRGEARG